MENLETTGFINSCIDYASTVLFNNDVKFDMNRDLLGCANGVWDFDKEVFRPCKFDDYITMNTNHVFRPMSVGLKSMDKDGVESVVEEVNEDDEAELKFWEDNLNQIFPDEGLCDLMKYIFSLGLTGKRLDKFILFNGRGGNGKGAMDETMEYMLGDYYCDVSPSICQENQKNISSSNANPALVNLDKKRFCVARELKPELPLCTTVIKRLTGSDSFSARPLYGEMQTVHNHGIMIAEVNDRPRCDSNPMTAMGRRWIDIYFKAVFTSEKTWWDSETGVRNHVYPVDMTKKEAMKTHANGLFNILVVYLLKLKQADYNIDDFIPASVHKRSEDYLHESVSVFQILEELFEQRNPRREYKEADVDVTLAEVVQRIRSSEQFRQIDKDEQAILKAKKVKELIANEKIYKVVKRPSTGQMVLQGWRRKPADSLEMDEEDPDEVQPLQLSTKPSSDPVVDDQKELLVPSTGKRAAAEPMEKVEDGKRGRALDATTKTAVREGLKIINKIGK